MIQIEKILQSAIDKDASDIHLICGLKPNLRIARSLVPEGDHILVEEDMYEIYDYIVKGNIDKDNVFKETKKLDTAIELNGIRFRVNISLSNEIPVICYHANYNEQCNGKNIYRCYSWYDIYVKIGEIK